MNLHPLKLEKEVPAGVGLSFWPFIDICLIGLFAALFGSKFVMAPGIAVQLPEVIEPQSSISARLHVLTVDEVEGKEVIIFQERLLNLTTFAKLLEKSGPVASGTDLLVRADAKVSWQTLASLIEAAEKGRYSHIKFSTERSSIEEERFGGSVE